MEDLEHIQRLWVYLQKMVTFRQKIMGQQRFCAIVSTAEADQFQPMVFLSKQLGYLDENIVAAKKKVVQLMCSNLFNNLACPAVPSFGSYSLFGGDCAAKEVPNKVDLEKLWKYLKKGENVSRDLNVKVQLNPVYDTQMKKDLYYKMLIDDTLELLYQYFNKLCNGQVNDLYYLWRQIDANVQKSKSYDGDKFDFTSM